MLVVMELHRLRIDVRLEAIAGDSQRWNLVRHVGASLRGGARAAPGRALSDFRDRYAPISRRRKCSTF
jgi:hypothetical protein